MEMTAVLEALKLCSNVDVIRIYSDSQYVVKGLTQWKAKWKKKGRLSDKDTRLLNKDLWNELDVAETGKNVRYYWVRRNSTEGLKMADYCAKEASQKIKNFKNI